MGQTQTAAVAEIDRTRRRLDSEIDELATYLPPYLPPTTAAVKRVAVIAAGALAGMALLRVALRKRREGRTVRHLRAIEDRLGRMEERLRR
ncbi:MAG TPA: hypothetical protein VLE71_02570 [Actinomycetota bacterium]|nr:hypothetical protein [Actinomycetota bacterium]